GKRKKSSRLQTDMDKFNLSEHKLAWGADYKRSFSPSAYLSSYFGPLGKSDGQGEQDVAYFILHCLHEAYNSGEPTPCVPPPGAVKGSRLLDVGTGPSLYQLFSACEKFSEIVLAEFSEENHQELHRWLSKDPHSHDWSSYLQYSCKLEGHRCKCKLHKPETQYSFTIIAELHDFELLLSNSWDIDLAALPSHYSCEEEKAEKLRNAIKKIIPCDVTLPNPLHPEVLPKFNVVQSSFCLECASSDETSFRGALQALRSLLLPSGHFVLIGALGQSFYKVGSVLFSALPMSEQFVRDSVQGAGFSIQTFKTLARPKDLEEDVTDVTSFFFLIADKV
uniref:indolethylamine N-methyltransferase-like n=1 Tax=Myxine glutinosa TaxID=7769 RepID=UPI00358ECC05